MLTSSYLQIFVFLMNLVASLLFCDISTTRTLAPMVDFLK